MNKELYRIKIGDLYLESIYLDSEEPNTYFIRDIDLTCQIEHSDKYTLEESTKIKEILSLIHINVEIEEIFTIID
jgi:hypothetical protein